MRPTFCSLAASNPPKLVLNNVNIILVAPKIPGNIGAVLRAGANFDAAGVCVVEPRCDPLDPDVYRLACDSPLLHSMQVLPNLKDALQHSQSSIGFTRRAGKGRTTHLSLRALTTAFPGVAQQIYKGYSNNNGGEVALVFGREESGLTDAEVALCVHACAIPSAETFPSLNLSHAVAVVLSHLFEMGLENSDCQLMGADGMIREMADNLASQGEVEALLARTVDLMERAGLDIRESSGGGDKSNHGRKRKPAGHLRAVLSRSQATTAEVRALHGVLKELERKYGASAAD